MFGGPSNAQNIRVIRPFSRRCATVSLPLPVPSSHANVWSSSTAKVPGTPRREVDVPVRGERRRRDEEERLPLDEGA